MEEIIATLRDGSLGSRSAAAEKLYNEAAGDETAKQRAVSLEVVELLVSFLGILHTQIHKFHGPASRHIGNTWANTDTTVSQNAHAGGHHSCKTLPEHYSTEAA